MDMNTTRIHKTKFDFGQELSRLLAVAFPSVALPFNIYFLFPQVASELGRSLGTEKLAGLSLGCLVGNITCLSVLVGVLTAADTLMPRAYGAGQYAEVGRLAVRAVLVSLVLLIPPVLPLCTVIEPMTNFLGQDPVASKLAASWIRVYLLGVPANLMAQRECSIDLSMSRFVRVFALFGTLRMTESFVHCFPQTTINQRLHRQCAVTFLTQSTDVHLLPKPGWLLRQGRGFSSSVSAVATSPKGMVEDGIIKLPEDKKTKKGNHKSTKPTSRINKSKSEIKVKEESESTITTKSRRKRKASKKKDDEAGATTDPPQYWTNSSDPFSIRLHAMNGTDDIVLDNPEQLAQYRATTIDGWITEEEATTTCTLVSVMVRGNPLPLRRHRTSRGFMYNPSAKAQAAFCQQVSNLVFGPEITNHTTTTTSSSKGNHNETDETNDDYLLTTASRTPWLGPPLFSADTALAVTLILRLKRPLSHFRASKRENCVLKTNAPHSLTSVTRTDADNLAKFVLDACNGLLYADDRQIQSLHVIKLLDNQDECLGSTQIFVQVIRDDMHGDILRHAHAPYQISKK